MCLTWKQPLDHFLKVVVIAKPIIECPYVAAIKHNIWITTWAVRMMTLVKARLMPADINKRAVTIRLNPVRRRICYEMQQCCNDTQQTCSKRQWPIDKHWCQRHCDNVCANFIHKQAAASLSQCSHNQSTLLHILHHVKNNTHWLITSCYWLNNNQLKQLKM